MAEVLPLLDERLAEGGIPLEQRSLLATIEFIEIFVVEVNFHSERRKPSESPKLLDEPWFPILHQDVRRWYRNRYGDAFDRSFKQTATGFVLLWHTSFRVEVPISVTKPGEGNDTFWIGFPDTVLENETPFDWLTSPPNRSRLSSSDEKFFLNSIHSVSGLLRSIHSSALGIRGLSGAGRGLVGTSIHHAERAADSVTLDTHPRVGKACWDLQMAAECSLKALLVREAGEFEKIHDLRRLAEAAVEYVPELNVGSVERLPEHRVMIELRYGTAAVPSIEQFFSLYVDTLKLLSECLKHLVKIYFGKGWIEIRKAPWASR